MGCAWEVVAGVEDELGDASDVGSGLAVGCTAATGVGLGWAAVRAGPQAATAIRASIGAAMKLASKRWEMDVRPERGGRISSLRLDGEEGWTRTPLAARRSGVVHLPDDPRRRALCLPLTTEENLALGWHRDPPHARGLLIDRGGRREKAEQLIRSFDVRPPDPLARAGDLSGGNQQKLVAARELEGGLAPKLVVAAQPSRGLDLAATRRLHEALRSAARGGAAVIVISSDLDELRSICHRVAVLFEGRIAGEADPSASDEVLGRLMLGHGGH